MHDFVTSDVEYNEEMQTRLDSENEVVLSLSSLFALSFGSVFSQVYHSVSATLQCWILPMCGEEQDGYSYAEESRNTGCL